jgi:hypothetical protein
LAKVNNKNQKEFKVRNVTLTILLILSLVGCTAVGPIKPEQKANIHNIAVISLLDKQLEFTKVGFTVFNNDHFTLDSSNWNVDEEVQKTINEQIQKSSPSIKIVKVPFNRSELLKIYKSPDSWGDYSSISRIEAELKSKLSQTPVDAVILVCKLRDQDPIAYTSIFIEGYGIYYRSLPFVDATLKPYALFSIVLLDSKTLKPITTRYVRGISPNFGKTQISWENQIKDNLSESMLLDFKSAIDTVIKSNLETGLHEMGL